MTDEKDDTSIQVGPDVVAAFTADAAFPYLISFPRTGSHWLRMMMELYFGIPSLVRLFYYLEATRFTCYHRHDDHLDIVRSNVLYLYRHPVDTVYSQLNYYREDPMQVDRVEHWARAYGRHLHKWLIADSFTTHKTILTYEGLRDDLPGEFAKVCRHFGQPFEQDRLAAAARSVTREEVKKRTRHDPQVIDLSESYAHQKQRFRKECAGLVMESVRSVHEELGSYFPTTEVLP